ncbi:hypothetical protein tinsulaeT_07720 [Thalassotalea insulae]|uniref:DUF1566 domain-containing protein n=1 Tax=Thalassotalea insulae TaxID=2056778 RepID=A0ABQ6GS26_9GAMM|nr:hypothetical protein [Thalassotalea insulae]GLX77432.1 hypothetical protein tinsulaeT_07720 [Thalassotalea insulae]
MTKLISQKFLQSSALAVSLLVSLSSTAGLIDNGNGTIYDDVLNITWLQNANIALTAGEHEFGVSTYGDAADFASDFSYLGYTEWRLPTTLAIDPSCSANYSDNDAYSHGINCTGSELGYMYYNNFGLAAGTDAATLINNANIDLFFNLSRSASYFSDPYIGMFDDDYDSWRFSMGNGEQHRAASGSGGLTWLVHDGRVSVSEPVSGAMLALGLMGLLMTRRRNS